MWYKSIQKIDPRAFDFKVSLYSELLSLFFKKNSPLKNDIECPVLVIAPMHDRYYYRDYLNRYYNSLKSEKELYWIDGSHISFDWLSEEINTKVLEWVKSK